MAFHTVVVESGSHLLMVEAQAQLLLRYIDTGLRQGTPWRAVLSRGVGKEDLLQALLDEPFPPLQFASDVPTHSKNRHAQEQGCPIGIALGDPPTNHRNANSCGQKCQHGGADPEPAVPGQCRVRILRVCQPPTAERGEHGSRCPGNHQRQRDRPG